MMHEARDKISAGTQNMTFEELKAYIKKQLSESNIKSLFKLTQDPSIGSGLIIMLLLPPKNWCLYPFK